MMLGISGGMFEKGETSVWWSGVRTLQLPALRFEFPPFLLLKTPVQPPSRSLDGQKDLINLSVLSLSTILGISFIQDLGEICLHVSYLSHIEQLELHL